MIKLAKPPVGLPRHPLPLLTAVTLAGWLLLGCGSSLDPARPLAASPQEVARPAPPAPTPPLALDLKALQGLDAIVPALAANRVVFVGETHDRYDHHLNQLEVLERLHARKPDLAIAAEWFQQPYQAHLDAYIDGEIDESSLLARTEYYERWRYDYRLYRPILAFAREHAIPVVALNVPTELTRKVGREGLAALTPAERSQLPAEIDRSDAEYRKRLQEVFAQHPNGEGDFENFYAVQLLWDEGMAARAAAYLREHPQRDLVVFAGAGHLMYGAGIPRRLARRVPAPYAVVLSNDGPVPDPEVADFLLVSTPAHLARAGRLGAFLESDEHGVRITGFSEASGAAAAGLNERDRIVAVAGEPVSSFADVKLMLIDRKPGESVTVEYEREGLLFGSAQRSAEVTLR